MTRQQRWAKAAYAHVKAQAAGGGARDYRTLCLKMPVLLQRGLVQALAFIRARSGEVGKAFCRDLAATYDERLAGGAADGELMKRAQEESDLSGYLALTRDLIAVSTWFRRFAQSELGSEGEP